MNDYTIIENLFENKNDIIDFQSFEESNVIRLNNNNNGVYDNDTILFNTQTVSSKLIDYSNAYVLIECSALIRYVANDDEEIVLGTFTLRNSDDIVQNCEIKLNNTIISDEKNIDRANFVNFILNNSNTNTFDYRNLKKITDHSTINNDNNRFITGPHTILTQDNADNTAKHTINFKFPLYLKDINDFFRKINLLEFAEFDINLRIKNPFIHTRANSSFRINNAFLYINEIKLNNSDNIKYLKMINTGYTKKINYLENNIRTFNNVTNGDQDFGLHNVRNCNSLYFYGVVNTRVTNNEYQTPNKNFNKINCLIDNIEIDNGIANNIQAYMNLKDKSIHNDSFLIDYSDFITNYRIYSFDVYRKIRDDNTNKFINITCNGVTNTPSTVYVFYKSYATITLKIDKQNGMTVYKNY